MSDQDIKEAMKEALKEWLDEKLATFGRWSLFGLASAGLAALAYLILVSQGWTPPTK